MGYWGVIPLRRRRGGAVGWGGSGGRGPFGGLAEGARDLEAADVGHGSGHEPLKFGLPSASVAGFTHAEILEVVDPALHLGSIAQQGHDLGVVLGGPSGGQALVVDTDKDGPPARRRGAIGSQGAGGTLGGVEAEQRPGRPL